MSRSPSDPSLRRETHVPTLADVAALAKVSTATVSRCLNEPERVGEATRKRVLEAVETLGYAPNFSARALAAKRTNTVGAVIPTMENAIFARAIQSFQEALDRHGITLLVASSSYSEAREADQIRTLVARGADGLLLIGYHRDESLYQFLETRGVPTLVAWSFDPTQQRTAIGFDNAAAMDRLARTAIGMGHRRIGFVSAEVASNDRAKGRVAGLHRAMDAIGIPRDQLTFVETQYGFEAGAEAVQDILRRAPDTTLVLCGNDVLAVGAIRGATAMGLAVPDDLSITGFDDIEVAQLSQPALTTVHVPHREMGRRAAETLVEMINSDTMPDSIELETEICLRGSLAGPRTA